jgi:hypothetical protein
MEEKEADKSKKGSGFFDVVRLEGRKRKWVEWTLMAIPELPGVCGMLYQMQFISTRN